MLHKMYKVTEDGRVLGRGRWGTKQPPDFFNELRYSKDKKGYLQASVIWNKRRQTRRVHRLVAEIYLPNPDNLPCVRHKDGNPMNNHKDNLSWSTYYDNEHDKKNHGTYSKRVGGRKLSDTDVMEIRNSDAKQMELANKYGVSRPTITRILNGTIWQSLS